jgi:hypothetical protein
MWINKTTALFTLSFILAAGCDLSFAQSKHGVRSIDFYNFTYRLYYGDKVTLKNGHYQKKYDPDSTAVFKCRLAILKYADFDGDGKEEAVALVQSIDTGGSNHGDNDYFVFTYRAGKLRQIFHKYTEGPEALCLKNRSIAIIAEAWEKEEIPHCCPPFTETKIYRWRGSDFALIKTYRQRNEPYKNRGAFERARKCENIR